MAETIESKDFVVKGDGTILRNEKCPNCGKEVYSKGDFCEHCGHKLHLVKEQDYEKKGAAWQYVVLGITTIFFGVFGIVLGFLLHRVVLDSNNELHYKYNEDTRKTGLAMIIMSVISSIIWMIAF
jgi:uncharacterized membrane protein